jgi:hypothetical protein
VKLGVAIGGRTHNCVVGIWERIRQKPWASTSPAAEDPALPCRRSGWGERRPGHRGLESAGTAEL